MTWAEAIVEKAAMVASATDMESAKAMAEEIAAMTQAILSGMDADGNGRVGWQEGEGRPGAGRDAPQAHERGGRAGLTAPQKG